MHSNIYVYIYIYILIFEYGFTFLIYTYVRCNLPFFTFAFCWRSQMCLCWTSPWKERGWERVCWEPKPTPSVQIWVSFSSYLLIPLLERLVAQYVRRHRPEFIQITTWNDPWLHILRSKFLCLAKTIHNCKGLQTHMVCESDFHSKNRQNPQRHAEAKEDKNENHPKHGGFTINALCDL